jgi:hypothetical protein
MTNRLPFAWKACQDGRALPPICVVRLANCATPFPRWFHDAQGRVRRSGCSSGESRQPRERAKKYGQKVLAIGFPLR